MTVPLIRPEIAGRAVPMDAVQPYPGNARRGNLEKIKNSLRKHGQYKELLIQDSTGFILVGNNTYAAMRELGYTQCAVLRLDVDEVKAREMLLIDNNSSDDSIYDERALAELLGEIQDWEATGFDPDDLDDLLVKLNQAGGDPETLAAALPPSLAAHAPMTLPEVPATDSRYGETAADEQARQERFEGNRPRYTKGLTEMILVYPEDQRTEALELLDGLRKSLGAQVRNGQIILGALRLLTEVHAGHARGDLAFDLAVALSTATPPVQDQDPGDGGDDPAAIEADAPPAPPPAAGYEGGEECGNDPNLTGPDVDVEDRVG